MIAALLAAALASPPCLACGPPPPLGVEAVTLGSRPDRLAAYADRLPVAYQLGVPTDEAAVALNLLRADRAASLGFPAVGAVQAPFLPPPVLPAPFPPAASPWSSAVPRGAGFSPARGSRAAGRVRP